MAGDCVFLTIL